MRRELPNDLLSLLTGLTPLKTDRAEMIKWVIFKLFVHLTHVYKMSIEVGNKTNII